MQLEANVLSNIHPHRQTNSRGGGRGGYAPQWQHPRGVRGRGRRPYTQNERRP